MTSNEFACKVLEMAEEMIECCKSAREELFLTMVSDVNNPDFAYELGYQNGVEHALDVVVGLENIFTGIANAEKAAKMKKQSLEGVKENA